MEINESMKFINGFSSLGKEVSDLSRAKRLLAKLGDPQNELEFIHIAGTNGKGSAAAMCAEALNDAGIRTGLFTSPYIKKYNDRIKFMGKDISDDMLCKICEIVKKRLDELDNPDEFSGFEITMAIALLYYKQSGCEIVVFEAGLGGLLDCTNVISSPLVSVITSISLDHTSVLGGTIKEIAVQKAGIIKKGCPCVMSADNPPDAAGIIRKTADKQSSRLIVPSFSDLKIFSEKIGNTSFEYKGTKYSLSQYGRHQIINAMSAIEALSAVRKKYRVTDQNIKNGVERARVEGRCEVIKKDPLIILDGCHNEGGAKALSKLLESHGEKFTFIVGALKGKDYKNTLLNLFKQADRFICVDDFYIKSVDKKALQSFLISQGQRAESSYSAAKAYQKALSGDYGSTVICGSLYLASYIKNL